jgi:hypothetical protein
MPTPLRIAGAAGLALVIILSPALVALGVPMAYGIGCDIIDNAGLATVCLALAAAIALNAGRRSWAQAAAKSIT